MTDPTTEYKGRSFTLPPMAQGKGRFHQDIVIGDEHQQEAWLRRDHSIPIMTRKRKQAAPGSPDEPYDVSKPWKVGKGPVSASSSVALVRWPMFVYDVNGYYRTLGVSPWATKVEIRQAYQKILEQGENLVRATYVFKQLINANIRKQYDSQPEGEIYLDSWEIQRIKDEARAEAIKRRMAQGLDVSDYDSNNAETLKVMDERGWVIPTPDDSKEDISEEYNWAYSFYRWRSTSYDINKLSRWQNILISSLAEQGAVLPLVVGFHRESIHPWKVAKVGSHYVAFLRDTEEINPESAAKCAATLISLHNNYASNTQSIKRTEETQ
jgi:hypothetical protein